MLLVLSRDRALSGVALGWSDVLVTLFGLLTPIAGLATGVVFLRWLLAARGLAAAESGTRPWRSTRLLLLGCVLPPLTLTVPGSTLAEIEHAGAGSDPAVRPTPSRPVLVWWASWATGVVLGLVTVVHGFATSTQALADGVVLHALVDVVAIVTAVATIRVVVHLTELLAPVLRPAGRAWVVRTAVAEPREGRQAPPRVATPPADARRRRVGALRRRLSRVRKSSTWNSVVAGAVARCAAASTSTRPPRPAP